MGSSEKNRQVFIIRIWREGRDIEGASPAWRGEIESTQTGERRYLKNLDDILAFIAPYLERMGVRLDLRWRVKQWWQGRKAPPPEKVTADES